MPNLTAQQMMKQFFQHFCKMDLFVTHGLHKSVKIIEAINVTAECRMPFLMFLNT